MDFLDIKSAVLQAGIRDGQRVLDVGTGAGHALITLSRAVGDAGRVYALDVQKELLTSVKFIIEHEHLANTEILWGDVELPGGVKLEDRAVDIVIFANVFFQIGDKAAALREARRLLKPSGKILLIDWAESYGGIGPSKEYVVSEHEAERLLMEAGFHKEKSFQAGPHHYGVLMTV
jgi:ubiquinone/menaquinone biosynthesis C-methylase UbiE